MTAGVVAPFPARPGGTVRDWIDRHASRTPDAVSHRFGDGAPPLTYGALREHARSVAERIGERGAVKGESVASFLDNGRPAVLVLFGLFYGGFRATPINLAAGPEAQRFALEHSGARFVVVGAEERPAFDRAAPPGIRILDADETTRSAPARDGGTVPAAPFPDDEALLMYTSGTTGRPKGVLHSHASLLAGGWTTATAHRLTPLDRALCVLPHFHINGLCVTWIAPLVSGGTSIVCRRFSARRFWEDCARHEATWFSVVPTIVSRLLHHDGEPDPAVLGRLRFGRSASAPLPPDVHRTFESRFGIPMIETMGLTETAAQILSNPLPPEARKTGSPGIAFGNEVAILDGDGRPLGPGMRGEIAARGPNVMRGYLRDEEATRAALAPDGWLRTGDLGHVDADGFVFVTGRIKELIIKGGENISPREIDDALHAHADVVEAAAFARPCDDFGQRVEAAVRVRESSAVSEEDLLRICRERLGAFRSPDRIHFVGELPKGPSGKIQRIRLASLLSSDPERAG